jgi:hypothetical protein
LAQNRGSGKSTRGKVTSAFRGPVSKEKVLGLSRARLTAPELKLKEDFNQRRRRNSETKRVSLTRVLTGTSRKTATVVDEDDQERLQAELHNGHGISRVRQNDDNAKLRTAVLTGEEHRHAGEPM